MNAKRKFYGGIILIVLFTCSLSAYHNNAKNNSYFKNSNKAELYKKYSNDYLKKGRTLQK